jgi:RNase P/RNase MRP subunit POP5
VVQTIIDGVLSIYGIDGLSRLDPKLVEFSEIEQKGIIRCTRDNLSEMRAALTFITNVGESDSAFYVDKVSGTLRSLRES